MNKGHTRYIMYIETKEHKNIPPIPDISWRSLMMLEKTISTKMWYFFRWIRLTKDDITFLRVYEVNFHTYKVNAINNSEYWRNLYCRFWLESTLVDFLLKGFSYYWEINFFSKNITTRKAKYLNDVSEIILKSIQEEKEYPKDTNGKEIIKDFYPLNWKIIINEKELKIWNWETKSEYFLKILSNILEKEESTEICFSDFVDEYYNQNEQNHEYENLNLSEINVRNSYIKTINKKVEAKYSVKDMIKLIDNYISIEVD